MENLTGGTPPVRYLLCVVPCKLYFVVVNILFRVCHSCRKYSRCALRHNNISIFSNLIKILLHIAGNSY